MSVEKESKLTPNSEAILGQEEKPGIAIESSEGLEKKDLTSPETDWSLINPNKREGLTQILKKKVIALETVSPYERSGLGDFQCLHKVFAERGVSRSLVTDRNFGLLDRIVNLLLTSRFSKEASLDKLDKNGLHEFRKHYNLSHMAMADIIEGLAYHLGKFGKENDLEKKEYRRLTAAYESSESRESHLASMRLRHGIYSLDLKAGKYAESFKGNNDILKLLEVPEIIYNKDLAEKDEQAAQKEYFDSYRNALNVILNLTEPNAAILAAKVIYGRMLTDTLLFNHSRSILFNDLANLFFKHKNKDCGLRAKAESGENDVKMAIGKYDAENPDEWRKPLLDAIEKAKTAIKNSRSIGHPVGEIGGLNLYVEADYRFAEQMVLSYGHGRLAEYIPEELELLETNLTRLTRNLTEAGNLSQKAHYTPPVKYKLLTEALNSLNKGGQIPGVEEIVGHILETNKME